MLDLPHNIQFLIYNVLYLGMDHPGREHRLVEMLAMVLLDHPWGHYSWRQSVMEKPSAVAQLVTLTELD